jgi:hypothetical protein
VVLLGVGVVAVVYELEGAVYALTGAGYEVVDAAPAAAAAFAALDSSQLMHHFAGGEAGAE